MNFIIALTVMCIGLKLTHFIDWSWWLVMSPLIISFVIVFVSMILVEFYVSR